MLDWLSSKVVLGIASMLILASAIGVFDHIRDRALEDELEDALESISKMMWELDRAQAGTSIMIEPGMDPFVGTIMDDTVDYYIYNGLIIGKVGGIRVTSVIPAVSSELDLPIHLQMAMVLEHTSTGLVIRENLA